VKHLPAKQALIYLLPETESNCKQLFAAPAQGNEMKKEYRSAIVRRSPAPIVH
jgi:hypothetical protein